MVMNHADYFERLCQVIRSETRDKIAQYNTQFIKNRVYRQQIRQGI